MIRRRPFQAKEIYEMPSEEARRWLAELQSAISALYCKVNQKNGNRLLMNIEASNMLVDWLQVALG
eukprot:2927281-Pyramimonas_sp.AAC.1